jgi:hypothetical protein
MNVTFPVEYTHQLAKELPVTTMPLVVKTRDGARWQVDGVRVDVNENDVPVEFVISVGPKEGV